MLPQPRSMSPSTYRAWHSPGYEQLTGAREQLFPVIRACLFAASCVDRLVRPSAAENVRHSVITLVTRVFENSVRGTLLGHGNFGGPGARERLWIIHGHPVLDRVGADAPEALDDTQVPAVRDSGRDTTHRMDRRLVREIRHLHNQRITFPVAA